MAGLLAMVEESVEDKVKYVRFGEKTCPQTEYQVCTFIKVI